MSAEQARPVDAVLVTGASSGLGLETALYLAGRDFTVYASLRDLTNGPRVLAAAERRGVALRVVQLDVTDRRSVDAAVHAVVSESGGIFGLVNNAGLGLRGCLEDLSEEEIRQVFETNVFGTMAVTRRALPHMRAAGRGRIVTISSVAGRIASFGLSGYCATKFALEGFAEALSLEIEPFGLYSSVVAPGIVRNEHWTTNRNVARSALDPASPYSRMFRRAEEIANRLVERSRTLEVHVARAVHRALTERRPRRRYPVGQPASLIVSLRRHIPGEMFDRLYFGLLLRQLTRQGRPL